MDAAVMVKLKGLKRALSELADATSPDATVRQMLMVLDLASLGGELSQQDISVRMDAGKGTVSRIVAMYAGPEGTVAHPKGYDLLAVDLDTNDLRNRLVRLSKRGQKIMTRVAGLL